MGCTFCHVSETYKLQNVNYIKIAFSQSVLKIETSGWNQKPQNSSIFHGDTCGTKWRQKTWILLKFIISSLNIFKMMPDRSRVTIIYKDI